MEPVKLARPSAADPARKIEIERKCIRKRWKMEKQSGWWVHAHRVCAHRREKQDKRMGVMARGGEEGVVKGAKNRDSICIQYWFQSDIVDSNFCDLLLTTQERKLSAYVKKDEAFRKSTPMHTDVIPVIDQTLIRE